MDEPEGGFWLCPQEPTELDARAMLEVAPDTYDWRIPDVAYNMQATAAVLLEPPTGSGWN